MRRFEVGLLTLFLLVNHHAAAQSAYEFSRRIDNPSGSIEGSGDEFGISIAQVGTKLVVGAYRDDTGAENAGAVHLFDGEGDLLHTIHNPTPEADDWFGFKVAPMGERILIAARNDSSDGNRGGAVYLYDQNGDLIKTIANPTGRGGDDFGNQIAGFGEHIFATAWRTDTVAEDAGAAYLFDAEELCCKNSSAPIQRLSHGLVVILRLSEMT